MLPAAKTPPRMLTLVILTGLSIVSLNLIAPSLAHIAEDFQVDYAIATLAIAGYLAITGVLQLFLGPLSDRFGRRPVILWGMAIFVIASAGCALADNIWIFLTFRMIQGAVIVGGALSRAVIRDMFETKEAASRMAYVSMAMAVAPMLGPMLGGILDQLFGWRASFWMFLLAGAGVFWLCWQDLGETNSEPSETFAKQFRAYPDLLTSRRFWGYSMVLTFSIGGFYVFVSGVPLVATSLLHLSPGVLGLFIGSTTLGFFFGSLLSGRIAHRYQLATMILAGRLASSAGLAVGLVAILLGHVNEFSLFGSVVSVGFGNGLSVPACNVGAMSIRPKLAGSASGLSGAMTVGGGAGLTSMTGWLVTAENGAWMLLSIMLAISLAGLVIAFYIRRIDLLEGPPEVT
ncbi:MAG: multidrug effflux MFS transporter [Rhodobacteraceae bacterium]|nr:multidrug effflux MFS transporter [Paracoccaceae bacterium]